MPENKEIRSVLSKCRARHMEAERQLMAESPHALGDRRYLVAGTAERGCYQAGYLAALRDVMSLLEVGGDFPSLRPSSPSASAASLGAGNASPTRSSG